MGEVLRFNRKQLKDVVRVVVGAQELRQIQVAEEICYYIPNDNKPINALVYSIHLAKAYSANGFERILYIRNQFNHAIAVMNDSIINLFEGDINVYVSKCGLILLWGTYDIYSTVDMQQLNFHRDLDSFFKKYKIKNIYLENGKDYISLENFKTGSVMSIPLYTAINLKSNCSGKISLPSNLL